MIRMLISQNVCRRMFFLFFTLCTSLSMYGDAFEHEATAAHTTNASFERSYKKHRDLQYYLYVQDFINSFISIPTTNVLVDSSTIASKYLAGRAPLYNKKNEKVGVCSASFLCMQNADGIFTDISNYISVDNGLIISWFTPTTLINLELDTIVHSMVTECIVRSTTKVGFNPFYGKTFNMIVSSDDQKIYFKLTKCY